MALATLILKTNSAARLSRPRASHPGVSGELERPGSRVRTDSARRPAQRGRRAAIGGESPGVGVRDRTPEASDSLAAASTPLSSTPPRLAGEGGREVKGTDRVPDGGCACCLSPLPPCYMYFSTLSEFFRVCRQA